MRVFEKPNYVNCVNISDNGSYDFLRRTPLKNHANITLFM